jgi:hypothetical protein
MKIHKKAAAAAAISTKGVSGMSEKTEREREEEVATET